MRRWLAAGLFLLPLAGAGQHADYAREQRWADEIVPSVVVGTAVSLELRSGHRVLGLYAGAPGAVAGVVLVHGLGLHPDWGLISALRTRLAEQGYATLSVQMPVLGADMKAASYPPTFPEADQRLALAIAFLRARGVRRIAIVGHSMGAQMANHFLAENSGHGVQAWVAIGLSGAFSSAEKLNVPVLDLHGERDLPAVLDAVPLRATAIRRWKGSGQAQVESADHFFTGREEELVRWTKRFLDRALR